MADLRVFPWIEETLRLNSEGEWESNGVVIEHERTQEAFHRGLRGPDATGRFWVVLGTGALREEKVALIASTPAVIETIQVKGLQFFARIRGRHEPEIIDWGSLRYEDPHFTIEISGRPLEKSDSTAWRARLLRTAHYQLLSHLDFQGTQVILRATQEFSRGMGLLVGASPEVWVDLTEACGIHYDSETQTLIQKGRP
jgi:hypothetical protein